MFDLPVLTKKERKAASDFRNFLLDKGFEMSQLSVYFRFCGSREKADAQVNSIRQRVPSSGKVSILFFTDYQFGQIVQIANRKPVKTPEKPEQLLLF